MALVAWNSTEYKVTEMDLLSVCVKILSPEVECPVDFSFSIVLLSTDISAGVMLIYYKYLSLSIADCLFLLRGRT